MNWFFILVVLLAPEGEYGGPIELTVRAHTEAGCTMARDAAKKQLAQNLVQHTLTSCVERR